MYDEIKENIANEYSENIEEKDKIEKELKRDWKNTIFFRVGIGTAISYAACIVGGILYSLYAPQGVWPLFMVGAGLTGFNLEKIIYHQRNKNSDKTNCRESMIKVLKNLGELAKIDGYNEVLEKEKEYVDFEEKMESGKEEDTDTKNYTENLKINYDKLEKLAANNDLKMNKKEKIVGRILFDVMGLGLGASIFTLFSGPMFGNNIVFKTGTVLSSLAGGYVLDKSWRDYETAVSSLDSETNNEAPTEINDVISDTAICKLMCDKQKVLSKRR